MISVIRSEILKLRTTRMWWAMALGIFLAGAVFAGFFAVVYTIDDPGTGAPVMSGTDAQVANTVYTAGLGVGYLLLLTIGVMPVSYTHLTLPTKRIV